MLPIECQIMLKNAADKKYSELLDKVIDEIKAMSPSHFFWGVKDPNLERRVFFHMPFSSKWSGTAVVHAQASKYKLRDATPTNAAYEIPRLIGEKK